MYKMTRSQNKRKIQIIAILMTIIMLTFIVFELLLNSCPDWFADSGNYFCHLSYRSEKPVTKGFNGEKIVHLDLKGAPPSVSYLKEFFPYIKKLGATGLLIEYEDMFPYKDELGNIKALNAYSMSEISEILDSAESNGLSVIPLIQTFAHFEFVLKLKEYRGLREVDSYPHVLCPSHRDVFPLLRRMIDQVLEAHPNSKYIHLGCDEVFALGTCPRCRKMMKINNWKEDHLFFDHVKRVAEYIVRAYPKVRPILWNDMLITKRAKFIEEYKIADVVDIMVWSYKTDVSVDVPDDLLKLYGRLFKSIWIASSYKGSTGVDKMITDANYHLENHISWMDLVSKWRAKIGFKGIALTGWQRYDHFSVLCELLPVSIPSLTLALRYLNETKKGIEPSVMKALNCPSPVALAPSQWKHLRIPECRFPGFPVYEIINQFYIFMTEFKLPSSHLISGWMSAYHVANRFSSPSHVETWIDLSHLSQTRMRVKIFEKKLREALSKVYDEHTVDEWITTKVTGLRIWCDAVQYSGAALLERKEWPRRPLLDNTDGVLQNSTNRICSSDNKNTCGLFLNMKLVNPLLKRSVVH